MELLRSEEIEEDGEAIRVPVDEVFGSGSAGVFGFGLEVPVAVEHGAEHGVTACVGEGCGCRLEDSASDVESHPVSLNSHGGKLEL